MIKTLNNDLKNAIKNRRLFLTEAMAKDSDFNIKNYLPDIQKQIKLEKLKFESNTNFPLITGNSTSTQKSKKSIFNHLTEIENINSTYILEGRNTKTIAGISLLIASKLIKPETINRKSICDEFATENTMDTVFDKIKSSLDKIIPLEYQSLIPNLSIK